MSQKISQFPAITKEELDHCVLASDTVSAIKDSQCLAGCALLDNNIWKNVSINLTDYFYTKGQVTQMINAGIVTLGAGKMIKTDDNGNLMASTLTENAINTHLTDTTIHVTDADKKNWNGKQSKINGMGSIIANKSNVTADAGKLLYISSEGKADISTLTISSINTHFNDKEKHITAAERTKWDNLDGFMYLDYADGYTIHWTEDYNETNYNSTNKNTTIYPEFTKTPINSDGARHVALHPRWVKLKAGVYQPSVTQFIDTNYQNLFKVNGAVNNTQYKKLHPKWFNAKKDYAYTGKDSTAYSAGNDLHLYPFYRAIGYTWATTTDNTKNAYPLHTAVIPPLSKNALYIIELWEGEYSYNGETAKIEYKAPDKNSSWVYIGSYPSMGESRLNLPIPAGGSIRISNLRADSFSCKITAFPTK